MIDPFLVSIFNIAVVAGCGAYLGWRGFAALFDIAGKLLAYGLLALVDFYQKRARTSR
jgi:hypothetical protein